MRRSPIGLYLTTLLFFVGFGLYGPQLAVFITEDLGLSATIAGTVLGATGLASVLTRFLVGVSSDRVRRRRIFIQAGLLLQAGGWVLAYLAPSAATLYAAKFLAGLCAATYVIYIVLYTSYFKRTNTAKAVGWLAVASPAGTFVGNRLGGMLTEASGDARITFAAAAVVAVLALATTFVFADDRPDIDIPFVRSDLTEQLSDRGLWAISAMAVIALIVPYATKDTAVPLLLSELGVGPAGLADYANVHVVSNAVAAVIAGQFLVPRLGLVVVTVIGALLQGAGTLAFVVSDNLTVLLAGEAVAGFGLGLNFTTLLTLVLVGIERRKQSTRMGLFQNIYSLAIFLGPQTVGVLIDNIGTSNTFIVFGSLSVLGGVLSVFLLRGYEARRAEQFEAQTSITEEKREKPVG